MSTTKARTLRLAAAFVLLGALPYSSAAIAQEFASVQAAEWVPVLLVPGWGDVADELTPLRRRLLSAGWPEASVAGLTFSDPVGSNVSNAEEVAAAVDALRARTGVAAVDIVAHSMGGLAVRAHLRDPEARAEVRRIVFLGTPHRGTLTAALAWGAGGREMVPGSDFLDRLNRGHEDGVGTEILSIRTPLDLTVIPSSSAMLPGAWNLEICCPSHHGLLNDERTFQALRAFLANGPSGLTAADGTIPLRTPPTWWLDAVRER